MWYVQSIIREGGDKDEKGIIGKSPYRRGCFMGSPEKSLSEKSC
jgi:hypothetical protein